MLAILATLEYYFNLKTRMQDLELSGAQSPNALDLCIVDIQVKDGLVGNCEQA